MNSRNIRAIQLAARCFCVFLLSNLAENAAGSQSAGALEPQRKVEGIMDNSFLVEEAYNQEPGVVQHILTAAHDFERRSDNTLWSLAFTQEWPIFSQQHQLSYTLPYDFLRNEGRSEDGFGDVLLHYRFQALASEQTLTAMALRASLILPTGDKGAGLGEDTVGVQLNVPFSTAIGDSWFAHFNAGLTWLPSAASAQDRDLWDFNLGASAIYAVTSDFHLLLEWVGVWGEYGDPGRSRGYEFSSLISPGMRKAFNFPNDSQLVLGVAAPIGLTRHAPDVGLFLYASFEHFFLRHDSE